MPPIVRTRLIPTILVILLAILSSSCTNQLKQTSYGNGLIPVKFTYVDGQAKEVSVAGNFNGWSPGSHRMIRRGNAWSAEISLPPGRYSYAFVVDGCTWRADPDASLWEDTGFGTRSSVLIVE